MRNLTKSRPASLFEPSQEGRWHALRLATRDDVDPGRLFQPFNAQRGHELKEVELHPQPGSIVIRDRARLRHQVEVERALVETHTTTSQ